MPNELDMNAYHQEGIDPGEHKVFNIGPEIHTFNTFNPTDTFNQRFSGDRQFSKPEDTFDQRFEGQSSNLPIRTPGDTTDIRPNVRDPESFPQDNFSRGGDMTIMPYDPVTMGKEPNKEYLFKFPEPWMGDPLNSNSRQMIGPPERPTLIHGQGDTLADQLTNIMQVSMKDPLKQLSRETMVGGGGTPSALGAPTVTKEPWFKSDTGVKLSKMLSAGQTYSQIAKAFNTTRNAIAGKIRDLGLAPNPTGTRDITTMKPGGSTTPRNLDEEMNDPEIKPLEPGARDEQGRLLRKSRTSRFDRPAGVRGEPPSTDELPKSSPYNPESENYDPELTKYLGKMKNPQQQQQAQDLRGTTRLYRGETDLPNEAKGNPSWVQETPEFKAIQQATGRWFTKDINEAHYYNKVHGDDTGRVSYVDVPTSDIESYLAKNHPEAKKFSAAPGEYFIPKELSDKRQLLEPETISQAAIRHPDTGKIYEGSAHYMAVEKAASTDYTAKDAYNIPWEEGFTTNNGRFVDREEAAKIQQAATGHYPHNKLISEDVHKFREEKRNRYKPLTDEDRQKLIDAWNEIINKK